MTGGVDDGIVQKEKKNLHNNISTNFWPPSRSEQQNRKNLKLAISCMDSSLMR